jgi:hypothetical protein
LLELEWHECRIARDEQRFSARGLTSKGCSDEHGRDQFCSEFHERPLEEWMHLFCASRFALGMNMQICLRSIGVRKSGCNIGYTRRLVVWWSGGYWWRVTRARAQLFTSVAACAGYTPRATSGRS